MKRKFAITLALFSWLCGANSTPAAIESQLQLKLLTPAGYLPGVPFLARAELRHEEGSLAREVWDTDATLDTPTPGISLSTNRIHLYNGIGSILVTVASGGDFELVASVGGFHASRQILCRTNETETTIGGTLPGSATTWRGIIRVTNDVTVPAGHTLTIESNTLVLINGVASGTVANDILINGGSIQSLGTELYPVTITATNQAWRWGQIRHNTAQPSVYNYTIITLGGRAPAEGHTGTAPVIRPTNSRITFIGCSLTDHADATGQPGKVMQASGSDLTFDNCLWSRSRMGPEIGGTSLVLSNSYILEIRGPDDSDGIYIHDQGAGKVCLITDCVIADGDDDGIDTLGSDVTVTNTIIRDWRSTFEDSKGISIFGGHVYFWHSLVVDCSVGISGKDSSKVTLYANDSTILGIVQAIGVTNKSGTQYPEVDYHLTNSILLAPDPIYSSYTNNSAPNYSNGLVHIDLYYCDVGEVWTNGWGNLTNSPLFVNAAAHDYQLDPYSPCINSGDPASPLDPDGTRADIGYFPFSHPAAILRNPAKLQGGGFQFLINAYSNRNYQVDMATNALGPWFILGTNQQTSENTLYEDTTATNDDIRIYRAKLVP